MNEAREEINVQKNIVRSQNIRLNEVEEELLDHKTKNEHLSFELGKGVKKNWLELPWVYTIHT